MQRFFSIVIIFGILIVGGGWVLMKRSDEQSRVKVAADLASARRGFADKARAAQREGDEGYARSIRAALSAYDEELGKRVFPGKPELRDPAKYEKDVEAHFQKSEIKEAQRKSMLEGYQIVRDAYDTLMSGKWTSVLTAKGASDTRLDLYTLARATDDGGRSVLDGKFFFWGVEDNTRMRWGQIALRFWKTEKEVVKEGRQVVERDVDKVLGKADGDAQPRLIIQTPARYVDSFPSYVSIGHLWLPMMPRDATSVDIEYSYVTQAAGGGEQTTTLKWEKVKVQDGWRLPEGETWEADVVEATEDEIAGKPAAEGAAAAP